MPRVTRIPPDPDVIRHRLVDALVKDGSIASREVEMAFRRIPRHTFLPDIPIEEAYRDEAIATHKAESGEWTSSSSQPTIMAIMLEMLQVEPDMKVMEIGAGTGYNAALLSVLTGAPDHVYTLDINPEYCHEAQANLERADIFGVQVLCRDGWLGNPDNAPYNRIILTASAYDIAPAWPEQLRDGGIIALPWGAPNGGMLATAFRKQGNSLTLERVSPCGFMRLRGQFDPVVDITGLEIPNRKTERPAQYLNPLSDPQLNNLMTFLAVYLFPQAHPRNFSVSGEPVQSMYGIVDLSNHSACCLTLGEPPTWQIWGDQALADLCEQTAQYWISLGRPSYNQLKMRAYPIGHAPPPQENERLLRREWFEYLVSWSQ